ncbi:MAG TPA: hypothetical protein VNC16_11155 [Solirubrobacterales bacterium]|nr:hypothetical protein [Solirubrobacterales bacterium]
MKITAAERDALLEQIHTRLTGIDEVWTATEAEDWEQAEKVAQGFADELRLVVEDLGWGETSGETIELTAEPEVLRRVLTRMQKRGEARREVEEGERTDLRLREEQTAQLLELCQRVLGELGDP